MESQSLDAHSKNEIESEYPKLELKARGEGRDTETVLVNLEEFSGVRLRLLKMDLNVMGIVCRCTTHC